MKKIYDKIVSDEVEQKVIEALATVKECKAEYDVLNLLLFNDFCFDFFLIHKPNIKKTVGGIYLTANGISLLKPRYGTSIFNFDLEGELNKYINHPEHVYGYVIKYKDEVMGEYYYRRGAAPYRDMLDNIFASFMILTDTYEIDDISKLIDKSFVKRNKYAFNNHGSIFAVDAGFLLDGVFDESVKESDDKTKLSSIKAMVRNRFLEIQNSFFENNIVLTDFDFYIVGENNRKRLFFKASMPQPQSDFKTDLSKNITIVSPEDNIAELLYKLAIDINAETFYAAVGYAFESGLSLIEPMLTVATEKATDEGLYIKQAEIVIGRLQRYNNGKIIKDINKATAEKIDFLMNSKRQIRLFTYQDSFYHGKFYYLAGKNQSYVIVGSSNITGPAYCNNLELDVLFSFDKSENNPQEMEFLEWYKRLKDKCIEIEELDVTRFAANTYSDENGSKTGESYYRNLTDEEERDRFNFLDGLNPTGFYEKPFYKNVKCFPFKKYVAFIYEEQGLVILEEFSYGRACYIFRSNSLDDVISELMDKNKQQVRESSLILDCVEHDDNYKDRIMSHFN